MASPEALEMSFLEIPNWNTSKDWPIKRFDVNLLCV